MCKAAAAVLLAELCVNCFAGRKIAKDMMKVGKAGHLYIAGYVSTFVTVFNVFTPRGGV